MMQRARLSQGNKVLMNMLRVDSLDSIIGMGLHDSGSTECVFDVKVDEEICKPKEKEVKPNETNELINRLLK